MHILDSIEAFRRVRRSLPGTVGFVPTMGALHSGHVTLFELAAKRTDHLVVSIFVNPMQFDRPDDLQSYPVDREGDLAKCREAGAEIVFFPTPQIMYPNGADQQLTHVEVHELDRFLCGETRPGHFRGVTTVVSKLYNIVQPDVAVFGQKDFQQLAVLQRMTRELNYPIEVIGAKTAREADGLAVSSRNLNIPAELRPRAQAMNRGLGLAWRAYRQGERSPKKVLALAQKSLEDAGLKIDYLELVDDNALQRCDGLVLPERGVVIAGAAFVGPVRIIDNLLFDEDLPIEIGLDET